MARSPLLHAIRQLAEAERLGVSLEELQERRLTRRELLRRSAGAGAVLAVGPALLGAGRTNAKGRRIAIVGGGIAGLSAALTLHDKGVAATVYEADPHRVGGRIRTSTATGNTTR